MARRALTLQEGKAPVWDRLLTMLFLAALLHALLILGLTFDAASAGGRGSAPGLEVLLVSDELPEADKNPEATYLAQRTQLGSGNTRDPVAPHNRSSSVPKLRHEGSIQGDSLTGSRRARRQPGGARADHLGLEHRRALPHRRGQQRRGTGAAAAH